MSYIPFKSFGLLERSTWRDPQSPGVFTYVSLDRADREPAFFVAAASINY